MEVELINLHLLVVHTFQRKKFDSPMTRNMLSVIQIIPVLLVCCPFPALAN